MVKCPICGSTRIRGDGKTFRCEKCGFEHRENSRGKVVISKTGYIDENHWMR